MENEKEARNERSVKQRFIYNIVKAVRKLQSNKLHGRESSKRASQGGVFALPILTGVC